MSEEKEQAENYAERNHCPFPKMMVKHRAQFNKILCIIYRIPDTGQGDDMETNKA